MQHTVSLDVMITEDRVVRLPDEIPQERARLILLPDEQNADEENTEPIQALPGILAEPGLAITRDVSISVMRSKVTEDGVVIPRVWLEGVNEVELHRVQDIIVVAPWSPAFAGIDGKLDYPSLAGAKGTL